MYIKYGYLEYNLNCESQQNEPHLLNWYNIKTRCKIIDCKVDDNFDDADVSMATWRLQAVAGLLTLNSAKILHQIFCHDD